MIQSTNLDIIPNFSESLLLKPSTKTNNTSSYISTLPQSIWGKIFNHLTFKSLDLFTNYKLNVLRIDLNGDEDPFRLTIDGVNIIYKHHFLNIVKETYNLALCCKAFYELTERERTLLLNTPLSTMIDKSFLSGRASLPTDLKFKPLKKLENKKPIDNYLLKWATPSIDILKNEEFIYKTFEAYQQSEKQALSLPQLPSAVGSRFSIDLNELKTKMDTAIYNDVLLPDDA